MDRNRIIVIEGGDGSGKATQFKLLLSRLAEKGIATVTFDFPRYKTPSAYFVEKYLNGGYGGLDEVAPQKASLFYALDRFEVSGEMREALKAGHLIICNRYVASNMAYQGAKFASIEERHRFLAWLFEIEFDILGIPRPGLNIILNVASQTSFQLVAQKNQREYIQVGNRDLHEKNFDYQESVRATYLEIAKLFSNDFTLVECMDSGRLMSPGEIHELVWEKVKNYLKI